ncbi:hypothetical protein IWZ03DRAFT_391203 [Phyllosticta citriasiana]|uniref:Uncharacterized protein n=1 Tax=Phyllosticta citriasiana TaxID=595635 RepID=A0ABR1K731_9PEZI
MSKIMAYSPKNALHMVWRGALGLHILMATRPMSWTDDDSRLFLVFAARHKWTADATTTAESKGVKHLQQELLVYTCNSALNTAIQHTLVEAVKDLLRHVQEMSVPNLFEWPVWTRRWFLDPAWDGTTAPQQQQLVQSAPNLSVTLHNSTDRNATGRQVNPMDVWELLEEQEQQMLFEAALERASILRASPRANRLGEPILRITYE